MNRIKPARWFSLVNRHPALPTELACVGNTH